MHTTIPIGFHSIAPQTETAVFSKSAHVHAMLIFVATTDSAIYAKMDDDEKAVFPFITHTSPLDWLLGAP